ncbi:unnamed protein product [Schistosoma margrebowiei]|uniref:Uncharacterized protein n=1 Tax=Schistosoma margrebowiei TaxID=48269 RepID=A0A183M3U5_9TREM|nr:unnamed protein product [Schistosoma margrebowiei]
MEAFSTLWRASKDRRYHTEFLCWIKLQNRVWSTVDKVVRSENRCQARLLTFTLSLSPAYRPHYKDVNIQGETLDTWTARIHMDDIDFTDNL